MQHGATSTGAYKLVPRGCDLTTPYVYNNEYTITKGIEHFQNGVISFPYGYEREDKTYRTYHGGFVEHAGIIYNNSNANKAKAFFRMTNSRRPGDHLANGQSYHDWLRENQRRYFKSPSMRRLCHHLGGHMLYGFNNIHDLELRLIEYCGLPHVKRRQRIRGIHEIIQNNIFGDETFTKKVIMNVKRDEFAKPGKLPRAIYDLSVIGSILGSYVIAILKERMSTFNMYGENEHRGVPDHEFQFIKSPDKDALREVFNKLESPKCTYFPFFSDDSCISIRCADGVFRANLDISSCDASNGAEVFNFLDNAVKRDRRAHKYVKGCIKQCTIPITLKSKSNPRDKIKLKPKGPKLYTGSVLTTIINNIANLSIYTAFCDVYSPNMSVKDCENALHQSAEMAGYMITLADCSDCFEDLQFLKHSPVRCPSGWEPVLNLGVILRILGNCRGDLPGRTTESLDLRSFKYNSSMVASLKHAGDYPFLQKLRAHFTRPFTEMRDVKHIKENFLIASVTSTSLSKPLSDEAVMKRYRVPGWGLEELAELLVSATYGVSICTVASQAILQTDYGL